MKLELLKPYISLNKAFLKQNLNRSDVELFKRNLIRLFSRINSSESEEHNKNIVSDFLKSTYYKNDFEINTADRKDLVIHLGRTSSEPVAVIIEAKRPDDKAGMISADKPNAKALHELIHYYLNERYIKNNKEIRNLIITDIYQWYIFDAQEFEKIFFENKQFIKTYLDWTNGVLPNKNTDWFYQDIAKPFIDNEIEILKCTYFNLHDFENIIKNDDKEDDINLINLYKILSPEHLLKLPFANDSNTLNKDFYNELLHIIGLCEVKKNGKKTIERLAPNERNEESLLENTISILQTYDIISRLKSQNFENFESFGDTTEEQLFSIALELCITWINRILFLKLLEGQLITYNNGNQDFAFLNTKTIKDLDEMSELFFDVLAVKIEDRSTGIQKKYSNIPYLNSSLFEISELEKHSIAINQLKDRYELPLFADTVLKTYQSGTKLHGKKPTLQYLLEFLDAYNFASQETAVIQEQNKTIINASVLGLIFEKINGYKEGSFFTPGYITMYMSRETIRKIVLQKFNKKYKWNCQEFDNIYNYLQKDKIQEYNELINSLKICDPAVGSGHFLVSALNELLAVKFDLEIVCDKNNKLLRGYKAIIENDEIHISIDEKELQYIPKNHESQRVQETLFREKQTIIENCLFGVDINPKSVQICRLRLWIELLKNSYYTQGSNYKELETLPNIDINIKCGNSLVSRFGLNGKNFSNGQMSKMQLATSQYKEQVLIYKNTSDKTTRKNAQREIERIKKQFSEVVNPTDEDFKKLKQKQSELANIPMFFDKEEKIQWDLKVIRLSKEVTDLETIYNQKLKTIYGNAFEWRFEFPEVLDDDGNFVGFDLILGNPPYISFQSNIFTPQIQNYYTSFYQNVFKIYDAFALFIERSISLLKQDSILYFICPSIILLNESFSKLRKNILTFGQLTEIVNCGDDVFEKAVVPTIIFGYEKNLNKKDVQINNFNSKIFSVGNKYHYEELFSNPEQGYNVFITNKYLTILNKIKKDSSIGEVLEIREAIKTGNDKYFISENYIDGYLPLISGKDIDKYTIFRHKYINFDSKELSRPTKLEYYKKPKLFIRRVGNNICATYDDSGLLATHVLYIGLLKSKKLNLKYILAILNSKLINWLYNTIYPKKGNVFPEIRIGNLRKLPFPIISEAKQKPLIKLVDTILELKKNNVNADTSKLENEIDNIVYKLYELSDEEIKIIENQ